MDVVIAGLCNVYTHYITTYEEYQVTDSLFPMWDDNSLKSSTHRILFLCYEKLKILQPQSQVQTISKILEIDVGGKVGRTGIVQTKEPLR